MRYEFKMPPQDIASLPAFLSRELLAISQAMSSPSERLNLTPLSAPPAKPRDGDLVYAVAPWNPGAGNGIYAHLGTTWTKLS